MNLNIGNEISEALDEMFPPLGNSQNFAMLHFSQYQEDGVSVNGDRSYGADDGNMATGKDFSADDLDDNYDKKPAAKSIGGAFSPKKEALLILRRLLTKQATLTSPSLFSNKTNQRSYFTPSDKDDDDFVPEQGYSDDDLFQDNKEEDWEDLSFYWTTRSSVGRKLNKGGHPKPDVAFMSEIEAKMALKEWMVKRKAFNDSVQYECRKSLQNET